MFIDTTPLPLCNIPKRDQNVCLQINTWIITCGISTQWRSIHNKNEGEKKTYLVHIVMQNSLEAIMLSRRD